MYEGSIMTISEDRRGGVYGTFREAFQETYDENLYRLSPRFFTSTSPNNCVVL